MTFAEQLTALPVNAGPHRLECFDSWLQGRTLYGGASALIAFDAAQRTIPDLPPLRAGQISFVAPPSRDIELRVETIRRGRNVAQIRSEIWCEGGCALSTIWLFGTEREANAAYKVDPVQDWPKGPGDAEIVPLAKAPPFLKNNFEIRRAQEISGAGEPIVRRWAKLSGESGLSPEQEIILLGDVLPPGSMRAMQRPGPLSSINWSVNMVGAPAHSPDGWWLVESRGEWAGSGYSSERLRLWDSTGQQYLSGLQSVAIFG